MRRTVVLDVVGLTPRLMGKRTPHLRQLFGEAAVIKAITPAVTCSMQSTFLTGKMPSEHGIVANGWYFRDLSEIWFWRQSNRLVQAEKIWEAARRRDASFTCANMFWWYNMVTDVDWAVTPRPLYRADGVKVPDCYSIPPDLRDRFNTEFGRFPLFKFWGPATSIQSSRWIAKAAMAVEDRFRPTLNLVYLPHLDYILQKVGPNGPIEEDLAEIDHLCGEAAGFFKDRGCRVIVLSEYGLTDVKTAVHPNRILREAGWLAVKTDLGREYLDPGACKAFAVCDHQVAHVYVRDRSDIPAVKRLFAGLSGVEQVLDEEGKKAQGLDHERSGELVLISSRDAWFTYYFWLDDRKAPDYARTVNIHAKPGYDPCELLIDPAIILPKMKIGLALLKKLLGFRYLMEVTPLDAGLVKGSHGRVTDHDEDGPIFMTTEPRLLPSGTIEAGRIRELILDHVFRD